MTWPGPPDRTPLTEPMRLGDILETILNPPNEAGFPVKEHQ